MKAFMSDKRGDIPQVLLLIGLIAIPIALFIASIGNEARDSSSQNINELTKEKDSLKKFD